VSSSSSSPSSSPALALEVEGVEISFGPVVALADLSLTVAREERVAVIGASGAGKSTLFAAVTRTVPLAGGRLSVHGEDITTLGPRAVRAARRRIGIVYQAYNLVPQLSVGLNVALGEIAGRSNRSALSALLRGPGAETSERVHSALRQVGLEDRVGDRAGDLSGGQQQRVAVARLLVQRPDLILADEPVAALDPVTATHVLRALAEAAEEGATLIVNLHDVSLARRFPRIVALRAGAVVFDGSPEELDDEVLRRVYASDGVIEEPESRFARDLVPAPLHDRESYGLRAR